jgi:hypothetical protein
MEQYGEETISSGGISWGLSGHRGHVDKSSLFLGYKEVFPNFGLFYFDKRRSYYKTVRPRITSGKKAWRILSTLDRPAVNKTGRNWKWRPAIMKL